MVVTFMREHGWRSSVWEGGIQDTFDGSVPSTRKHHRGPGRCFTDKTSLGLLLLWSWKVFLLCFLSQLEIFFLLRPKKEIHLQTRGDQLCVLEPITYPLGASVYLRSEGCIGLLGLQ